MTFTADTAERRPPKLPFWSTVGRAYAAPFMSFGSLMRAGWLWLLVLAPALAVVAWFQVPLQAASLARQGTVPAPADEVWQLWLLTTLQQIATVPAMASIAVAWHRLIIMDIGIGEAWRATRDNSWRLFLGPVVCVLFMMIPGFFAINTTVADRPIATLVMTTFYLFALLGGVFAVGFLSFAYHHFFQGEPRRTD